MTADPASSPSDPEAPEGLSVSRPDLARRLGVSAAPLALPEGGPGAALSHHLPPDTRSFPKRVERYFSAVTKLGRLYTGLKEVLLRIGMLEIRLDADREDTANRLNDLADRIETGDHGPEMPHDALDALRDTADAEREKRAALETRLDAAESALDAATGAMAERVREIAALRADLSGETGFLRTELSETAGSLRDAMGVQASEQLGTARAYTDLTRRLDILRAGGSAAPPSDPADRPGLDALLDAFYARLEDRYRGSREEIMRRLVKYLPDAEAAVARTGKPVLDLGCGRGEWLELLRSKDIEATGVDLNEMQLRDAQALGLDARQGEAAAFLAGQPDGSRAMITAHHLAEHLPFPDLVWLTREAMRVLAPGGVLVYETPNPANLIVGASNFHIDPTHLRPLPSQPLTTLFDVVGFDPVEARFLHPHPKQDLLPRQGRLDPEVAGLLFGAQDLAVVGTKPALAP